MKPRVKRDYNAGADAQKERWFMRAIVPAMILACVPVLHASDRDTTALIRQLSDKDAGNRIMAASELMEFVKPGSTDPKLFQAMIAALGDANPYVREAVVRALRFCGDSRAVQPLSIALKDKSSEVRRYAIYSLGEIGDPAENVRRAASRALAVFEPVR